MFAELNQLKLHPEHLRPRAHFTDKGVGTQGAEALCVGPEKGGQTGCLLVLSGNLDGT